MECLDGLMRMFLSNPEPQTLDATYVAKMRPPPFVTK